MKSLAAKHGDIVKLLVEFFDVYDPKKINVKDKELNAQALVDLQIILAKFEDFFMSLKDWHLDGFDEFLEAHGTSLEKIKEDAVKRCGSNGIALLLFYSNLLNEYSKFIVNLNNN